jgi:LacI family transcriptional regulator
MLVPSLTWSWIAEVLQGVVDTVEAAGYGLLLNTCNRGTESVERFVAQVSARAFDGLLVVEPENTLETIAAMHRGGLPVGPAHFPCVQDRLRGFAAVLAEPRVAPGGFTERSGRLAVEHHIAAGTRFDSVFAHNDLSAAGALRALRAGAGRCPTTSPWWASTTCRWPGTPNLR